MMGISNMFQAWSSLRRFNATTPADRSIVFYAESRADWPHLGPLIEELTGTHGRSVCYVTSDEGDPLLAAPIPGVQTFYVGSGTTRTTFFKLLDAGILVMTLPDLETFHLKRSVHPVHYVYVFHSMVSTHMIYRKGAFDAYDTVFCVGPHHMREIRRTEELYGLRPKELVEHGYGRLDTILGATADLPRRASGAGPSRRILLAPSWGECSFIEQPYGVELIGLLLNAGHAVVLRLHPMTVRRFPRLAAQVSERFTGQDFRVETDMREQRSLQESDLMIGDWSGAALEYAFGLERPVLFVDTPKKVNNPEYERLDMVSLEESIRTEIGEIVDPSDLAAALPLVESLCSDPGAFSERLREARSRSVYNVGRSAPVGAALLTQLADRERKEAGSQIAT